MAVGHNHRVGLAHKKDEQMNTCPIHNVNYIFVCFYCQSEKIAEIEDCDPNPFCIICGTQLIDGGYIIEGQDYCTKDECAKKGIV